MKVLVAKIIFILSIVFLLLPVLMFGLAFLIREDGGQKLSQLITDHWDGLTLEYTSADIHFSFGGFHLTATDLTLTLNKDRIRSPQADIWWQQNRLFIALEEAEMDISDELTAAPPLPIELLADAARIHIPALSVTLSNADVALSADSNRWLVNLTDRQAEQRLHVRAGSRDWRRIRLYAEADNFPLPLPFDSRDMKITLVADIGDTIQYAAGGSGDAIRAATPPLTIDAVRWHSRGSRHYNGDILLTIALQADQLALAPDITVAVLTATAILQRQQDDWTLHNAQLNLSAPSARVTASFSGSGQQRDDCAADYPCLENTVIDYFALAVTSLPQAPALTVQIGSDGRWRQTAAGWQLIADELQMVSDDMVIDLSATIENDRAAALTAVTADGTVGTVAAPAIARYFPDGAVKQWLTDNLTAGTVERGNFTLHSGGDFSAANTTLRITAAFTDGEINIGEGWPPARQLRGTLAINNDDLLIYGGGTFDGLAASTVAALIPHMRDEQVTLFLNILGDPAALAEHAATARRVSLLSPFIAEADELFTLRGSGGRGALSLSLSVPLSETQNSRVQAHLAVQHGAVNLPQLPAYSSIKGDVYFNRRGVRGRLSGKLAATGLEAPRLTLVFDDTRLTLSGTAEVSLLLSVAGISEPRLSGATPFIFSHSATATVFSTAMDGAIIDLPRPLGKGKGTTTPLTVQFVDDIIHARYQNDYLTINIRTAPEGGSDVAINAAAADPPAAGVRLHGSAADIPLDLWLPQIGGGDGDGFLSTIRLTLSQVDLMGATNEHFIIRGGQRASHAPFSLYVDSSSALGQIVLSDNALNGDFSYLKLPAAQSSPGNRGTLLSVLAITISAATLSFADLTLGALALSGAPAPDSWQLDKLAVYNQSITLNMGGTYENQYTFLTVHLQVAHLPSLMTVLQIAPIFGSGQATLIGKLGWPGSPADFDLSKMKGGLRLLASDVQYLDTEFGTEVINFLSVFSPQSLFSLGFTELGKGGIIFSSVQGDIALSQGAAQLQPINLVSSDILMDIQGSTNYLYRRHDLHGRVRPGEKILGAGSAVGLGAQLVGTGLTAINPASLVAGVLFGKIFEKPISEIGGYDYTIKGSWKDPVYEEIGIIESSGNGDNSGEAAPAAAENEQ